MSLQDLQTLDETQRTRDRAQPKPDTSSLTRSIARKGARRLDRDRLIVWAQTVKDRDRWRDRKTRQRVYPTDVVDPLRAEAHHIEPKADKRVRYDPRNGVCLSLATHALVTSGILRIEGTAWFRVKGQRYIDGRKPIYFVRCQ